MLPVVSWIASVRFELNYVPVLHFDVFNLSLWLLTFRIEDR